MSKYLNNKIETPEDGVFDSKLEFYRWNMLKHEQRLGNIQNLVRQKEFELIPSQTEKIQRIGKRGEPLKPIVRVVERACNYTADFYYEKVEHEPFGQAFGEAIATGKGSTTKVTPVVEDCKSDITKTPDYVLRRKMMLYFHGIKIREVKRATEPI